MKDGINVLSLFDGMSAGLQALKQAGIPVKNYYASEIDKYAIQIAQKNHPEIQQLGDVTAWRSWDLPKIDLLIGGSPCQGFSSAGKGLNFDDPRSALFFEFVKILKELNPRFFMLENVKMSQSQRKVITDLLLVDPVKINSNLVSAQNRERFYWANFKIDQPGDLGIYLKDVIDCEDENPKIMQIPRGFNKGGIKGKNGKSPTLTSSSWQHNNHLVIGQMQPFPRDYNKKGLPRVERFEHRTDGKSNSCITSPSKNLLSVGAGLRKLSPIECERLQTLPDNYTQGVSDGQRYKIIGNSWTISAIEHIFKAIPL